VRLRRTALALFVVIGLVIPAIGSTSSGILGASSEVLTSSKLTQEQAEAIARQILGGEVVHEVIKQDAGDVTAASYWDCATRVDLYPDWVGNTAKIQYQGGAY